MSLNKVSNRVDYDRVAKLLGARSLDDVDDDFCMRDDTYGLAYKDAINEGLSEDEAEEKARIAEEKERDDHTNKYLNALESVFETMLGEHSLTFEKKQHPKYGTVFLIKPVVDWKSSANAIRETINGAGPFYFSTLREFLDSGPYTPRGAVLNHLGWLKDHPAVYGDRSYASQVDRAFWGH